MEKAKWEKPVVEIVPFACADIITASGTSGNNNNGAIYLPEVP